MKIVIVAITILLFVFSVTSESQVSNTVTFGSTGRYTATGVTDSINTARYGQVKVFFTCTKVDTIDVIIEGSAGYVGGSYKWTNVSSIGDTERYIMAVDDSSQSLEVTTAWPLLRARIIKLAGATGKAIQVYAIGQN
jgi:hypothetical protein